MANDALDHYVNPTDTLSTTDAYRAFAVWIHWLAMVDARYLIELVAGSDYELADSASRVNDPHGHGESDGSETVYRSVIDHMFTTGSANYAAFVVAALGAGDWVEVARQRCWIGNVGAVKSEVYFAHTQTAGESVRWKIEIRPWVDSAGAGAVQHYIAEAAGTVACPGPDWHTISGQLDGAGGAVEELTVTNARALHEIRLYARLDGAVAQELDLYSWHVWEDAA